MTTWYGSNTHISCGILSPRIPGILAIADNESSLTKTSATSFVSNELTTRRMTGIVLRQGEHQVAQKSRITTFGCSLEERSFSPHRSLRKKNSPFSDRRAKVGAGSPVLSSAEKAEMWIASNKTQPNLTMYFSRRQHTRGFRRSCKKKIQPKYG